MNITLLDGRVIDAEAIDFDANTYTFVAHYADGSGSEDVTKLIRNADKRNFDGFDNDFYNQLLYVQNYKRTHGGQMPPQIGSESFWANFAEQMKDPLAAPLESLDNVVSDILRSTGVQTILVVGGVALVLIILAKR